MHSSRCCHKTKHMLHSQLCAYRHFDDVGCCPWYRDQIRILTVLSIIFQTLAMRKFVQCIYFACLCFIAHCKSSQARYKITPGELMQEELFHMKNPVMTDGLNRTAIKTRQDSSGTAVDGKSSCVLNITRQSALYFTYKAHSEDLSYVFLRLKLLHGLNLNASETTVGGNIWIWTYVGHLGGFEFLSWPISFGIWSMGFLYTYVDTIDIELYNTSGDCAQLKVGERETDIVISKALANLVEMMIAVDGNDERYGPSYLCYKRKTKRNYQILYQLCVYVLCPAEYLEHACYFYSYNQTREHRQISTHEWKYSYDTFWWIGPIIIAVALFVFCPLVLLRCAHSCSKAITTFEGNNNDSEVDYIFLDGTKQITLVKTLLSPLLNKCLKIRHVYSRLCRCTLPFLSLSIVCLQVLLDHHEFLQEAVTESIRKDVPMGFRAMFHGYKMTCHNYLPEFGGPFIACLAYVCITIVLISVPTSLSNTLETGIYETNTEECASALCMSLRHLESYGSVLIRHRRGYTKVYSVILGRFNCVVNFKFWNFVLQLQVSRWRHFSTKRKYCVLLPFYIISCFLEILLCTLVNGIPVISFAVIVYRSYRNLLRQSMETCGCKLLLWFLMVVLLISSTYSFFMFSTIFLDACLFTSRVAIFTFTGVLIYPRVSFGYLILFATVTFYLFECFECFASHYTNLLYLTVSACESIERTSDTKQLVRSHGHSKGIMKRLFNDVAELYSPRRKKVLTTLLCFSFTIYILVMSVHLIMKRDALKDLPIIVHVGTTLFVCAFPKIIKSMFFARENKRRQKKERKEIKIIVKRCLNSSTDDEVCFDEE